jgi:hypothetical protein
MLSGVVVLQMIASLKGPGLMGLMSAGVPASEQGVMQGSIMSLRVLSKAVGAPIFGAVLSYALKADVVAQHGRWIEGTPFLVAGGFDLVGTIICYLVFTFTAYGKAVRAMEGSTAGNVQGIPPRDVSRETTGQSPSMTSEESRSPRAIARPSSP